MSIQALHFAAPTIEVVSQSPRLEMLQSRLKQAGLRPIRAPNNIDPNLASPLLIDAAVVSAQDRQIIVSACERQAVRPIILLDGAASDHGMAIQLRTLDQLSTLPARLDLRQRQLGQDREMELRRETIAHLSPTASTPALPINTNVVYFGPYTPRFSILRSQLSDQGITLKAALTAHSLRDACEAHNATAVLFDISDEDASVTDALKSFTEHPTKANVAKIILTAPDQVMPNIELADHIIDTDDTDRTAQVIHQIAACQSTAMPSDPSITDNATGLFTRTFLEAHLSAQLKAADQTGQPLTLIGIKLSDHLRGKKSTGDILRKHLRMTDLAARYSARHIVISLPATAYGGAV
ncbi:MAG: hypothetical protein AAGG45_08440, partial [Pseudomonadota bacterium]